MNRGIWEDWAWEKLRKVLREAVRETYAEVDLLPEEAAPALPPGTYLVGQVKDLRRHRRDVTRKRRGPTPRSQADAMAIVMKAYNDAKVEHDCPDIKDAARKGGYTAGGFRKICRQAGMEPYEWPPVHNPSCHRHQGGT